MKIFDGQIIDNFLDSNDFTKIKNILLSENFPWFFYDSVVSEKECNEDCFFVHTFYAQNKPNSIFYDDLNVLYEKLDVKALVRVKSNLYPRYHKLIEHEFHLDQPFYHKGAIFYINDNNGYTLFEDGTKINSKSNRLLIFDSSKISHKSTNCTDSKFRININLNYF